MVFSFVAHGAGGLVAGQAVALTMTGLVHVPAGQLPGTYLAGAAAESGWRAIGWGGVHGVRPYGVAGTLLAIGVSPVLGSVAAAGVRRCLGRVLHRASRDVVRSPRKTSTGAISASPKQS
jgi:hypothetical protein